MSQFLFFSFPVPMCVSFELPSSSSALWNRPICSWYDLSKTCLWSHFFPDQTHKGHPTASSILFKFLTTDIKAFHCLTSSFPPSHGLHLDFNTYTLTHLLPVLHILVLINTWSHRITHKHVYSNVFMSTHPDIHTYTFTYAVTYICTHCINSMYAHLSYA